MLVLGIESSCDETGIALYDSQQGLLGHALHSQIDMHQAYGGVVPELASRDHIQRALPLFKEVLNASQKTPQEIDAIAYTQGPGLAGALLVGASIACGLGFSLGKPMIGIHHLEGHLLSPLLSKNPPPFPFVALLVSGGHTQLMRVNDVGDYTLLGETKDDAAGEAFDKSAKLLGIDYPGGPLLSQLAKKGQAGHYTLPRPMLHSPDLNFSFSGLKTAVLTLVKNQSSPLKQTGLKKLVIAGGVGANLQLRHALNTAAQEKNFDVFYPELHFCTDNGAMIALAGALRLQKYPHAAEYNYAFNVKPRWPLNLG
jgi:N6-L-threonylcarbamoyladenine synthase